MLFLFVSGCVFLYFWVLEHVKKIIVCNLRESGNGL